MPFIYLAFVYLNADLNGMLAVVLGSRFHSVEDTSLAVARMPF
jgi:hypothetical protein